MAASVQVLERNPLIVWIEAFVVTCSGIFWYIVQASNRFASLGITICYLLACYTYPQKVALIGLTEVEYSSTGSRESLPDVTAPAAPSNIPVNYSTRVQVRPHRRDVTSQRSQEDYVTETDTDSEQFADDASSTSRGSWQGMRYRETIVRSPDPKNRKHSAEIGRVVKATDDSFTRDLFSDTEIVNRQRKQNASSVKIPEDMGSKQYPTMGNLHDLSFESDSDTWNDFMKYKETTFKTSDRRQSQSSRTSSIPVSQVVIENESSFEETTTCSTTNEESITRTVVKDNNLYKPPYFLKSLQPQIVTIGSTATFTACVTGNPSPNISWYWDIPDPSQPRMTTHAKDDSLSHKIEILNSDRFRTSYDRHLGVCILTIHRVTVDDLTNVSCVARNIAGRASSIANLVTVRKYCKP